MKMQEKYSWNYVEYFKIAQMYIKIYAIHSKNNTEINNVKNMNMNEKNEKNNNNTDEVIEMGDACNNNNKNQCNFTQTDIHIKNNIFENIGNTNFRRTTEMPK